MSSETVNIYDLMACNVYMDFDTPLPKEQHKFLLAFHPTGGRPVHELVETITAIGPNGYEVDIANQEFTRSNLNGWIYDRTTNSHWYMVNLTTGFMDPGEYRIVVQCKDGATTEISRTQDNTSTDRMTTAYLQNREKLKNSYHPGQNEKLPDGAPLHNIKVTCDSLSELSGVDAYYVFRLCEAASALEFDTQKLYWWDNIFLQRLTNPEAGKNRTTLVLGAALKPDTAYTYFCELTDSNSMGGTNICIFQPHQTFHS